MVLIRSVIRKHLGVTLEPHISFAVRKCRRNSSKFGIGFLYRFIISILVQLNFAAKLYARMLTGKQESKEMSKKELAIIGNVKEEWLMEHVKYNEIFCLFVLKGHN